MTQPIASIRRPSFTVLMFGHEHMDNHQLSEGYGIEPGQTCLMKAASSSSSPGFREVKQATFGITNWNNPHVYSDSVIGIKPSQAAMMRSADCGAVVLHEKTSNLWCLTHCGRHAMTPVVQAGTPLTVLHSAFAKLTHGIKNPEVEAVIIGSICKYHFAHAHIGPGTQVRAYIDHFGDWVIHDWNRGTLDMPAIIRYCLLKLGVSQEHIVTDETCPYEHPALASHARDADGRRNPILLLTS